MAGIRIDPDPTLDQGDKGRTPERLSKESNISHGTLHKIEKIQEKASCDIKEALSMASNFASNSDL